MVRRTVFESLALLLSATGSEEIWVACSGGLDSMALLALVKEFALDNSLPVGVVHLNHNLRPESVDDEKFVADYALKSGFPLLLDQVRNLREEVANSSQSLETAARNHRYAFFQRLLDRRKQALLVTAHNATDQVETIMMNLMRGTGLRGVKGIPRRRGRIGRPLLLLPRARLECYVAENNIPFREDSSNSSLEFTRNRVRHELLPVIRKLGGAGVEERIAGAGLRLADDLNIVNRKVDELWHWVEFVEQGIIVPRELLQKSEIEILPHLLGRMIRHSGGLKQVSARVLDDLVALVGTVGSHRQSHYDLGSGLIFKVLPEMVFVGKESDHGAFAAALPEYRMILPEYGTYLLPHALGKIKVNSPVLLNANNDSENKLFISAGESGLTEMVAADMLEFPLILRNRRPGDSFQPLGMNGRSCRLKKFFQSHNFSHRERSTKPLLCNCGGEIIWVVGERLDHRFRVTSATRKIIKLNYLPNESPNESPSES